jgi:hypothetical protein
MAGFGAGSKLKCCGVSAESHTKVSPETHCAALKATKDTDARGGIVSFVAFTCEEFWLIAFVRRSVSEGVMPLQPSGGQRCNDDRLADAILHCKQGVQLTTLDSFEPFVIR